MLLEDLAAYRRLSFLVFFLYLLMDTIFDTPAVDLISYDETPTALYYWMEGDLVLDDEVPLYQQYSL